MYRDCALYRSEGFQALEPVTTPISDSEEEARKAEDRNLRRSLALAVIFGIGVGLLLARFWVLDVALNVYITFLYSIPSVALVPLIVLWAGYETTAKVIILFLFAFFPMVINTYQGVKAVDPKLTTADAKAFAPNMKMISSYSVYYWVIINNHWGGNIEAPATKIDGTVVPAGGIFDFWKVVGDLHRLPGEGQGNAIEGGTITVTNDPDEVRNADRIVLPGVGAFADCRHGLDNI